jgi:hypothetical protein
VEREFIENCLQKNNYEKTFTIKLG